jgi:hypothetical protein
MPGFNSNHSGPFSNPTGQRGGRGAIARREIGREHTTTEVLPLEPPAAMSQNETNRDNQGEAASLIKADSIEDQNLPLPPPPTTTSLQERLLESERMITQLRESVAALEARRGQEAASSECSHVFLRSRVAELEHLNRHHEHERIRMETQLRREADSQRAAEALCAQRAEERMQSAVDAAVQSAVERVRSEAQDEMEAERHWWRVEVERVRR